MTAESGKRKFSGVQPHSKNTPYIALPFNLLFGVWKPIARSKIQIITNITLTCINYLTLQAKVVGNHNFKETDKMS